MSQLTLRLEENLAGQVKSAAAARGMSVNRWASSVLRAAVDPDLAGDEAERLRARLVRAGLLQPPSETREGGAKARPDARAVARARARAGRGRRLADLVSEDRSPSPR
ncbi:MAG: transcriptional regulator [Acidimicrobiales bacterium]